MATSGVAPREVAGERRGAGVPGGAPRRVAREPRPGRVRRRSQEGRRERRGVATSGGTPGPVTVCSVAAWPARPGLAGPPAGSHRFGAPPIAGPARARGRWLTLATLALLVGFGLRVYRLADHNVWWDEGFSVYLARMPLASMVVRTAADVHPPLHYAFLHYWDRLVGESEYAIRYSTALFGVLDLALLYWLARRYLGPAVALGAVLLLALNRLHVEWSQEMRMYTLATALVLLSTACFLRLTSERDTRPRWWLAHLALSVAGLHTIYVFGLAPLCQTIAVLIGLVAPLGGRRLSVGFVTRWLTVQAAAVALFLPWVLLFLRQPRARPVLIYPIDLLTWVRAVYTALPIGISAYLERWTLVTLGASLLFLLPLAVAPRRGWVLLAAYPPLLLSPLLLYALSYPNPVLYAPNLSVRYVILFLPLYCALIALGLSAVARRSRPAAAALALAAPSPCRSPPPPTSTGRGGCATSTGRSRASSTPTPSRATGSCSTRTGTGRSSSTTSAPPCPATASGPTGSRPPSRRPGSARICSTGTPRSGW